MPNILKHQPEAQEHTESIDARILYTIREGLYRILDTIHPSLTLKVNQLLIRLKMWELRVLGKHANTLAYHEPDRLILATNNTCNFKCVWCPQSLDNFRSSYTMADMRLEDIEAILQHQKRPLSHIDIQGIGEPLLHRDIIRIIKLAGKHARNVEMVTNGSLLDEHRRAQLKQSALTKLCVSIDGTDEETFQRIRGWSFEKIKDNVHRFLEETDIPVEFWVTISSENVESLEKLPEFMEEFPGVSLEFQIIREGFIGNNEWRLDPDTLTNFKKILGAKLDAQHIPHNLRSIRYIPEQQEGICEFPFVRKASISTDGNLTPCCIWTNNDLSQVKEVDIARAWNSDAIRKFRTLMLQQNYPQFCCEACNYAPRTKK